MPNTCMRGCFTLLHTQNSSLEERARRCRHTAGAWLPPLHAGSSSDRTRAITCDLQGSHACLR